MTAPGTARTAPGAGDKPADRAALATLERSLRGAVDGGLAHLRRLDPEAASDLDDLRERAGDRPVVVVVGETKRGKSALTNALIGVPDLSPVDADLATSAYLEFAFGSPHGARAHVPGTPDAVPLRLDQLRDWGTVLGSLPDNVRPPRRIEVTHSAPLLQYVSLVDTPGVGGLDPRHADVTLDAVARATALLFVVDASTPFSRPELDFLIEASKRVNLVLFALTKTDTYPGWRTVYNDDRALLQAHAPRFGSAPFFPVSARLAELALQMPPDAAAEVVAESRIAELQQALIGLATTGQVLEQANVLRSVRTEFVRLDTETAARIRAADPDPNALAHLVEERAAVAARKRTETRQWSLALNTETQRARVEAVGRLRTAVAELQEHYLNAIEKASGSTLDRLPYEVDQALHGLSVRLSGELEGRFRLVAQRVLAAVFSGDELQSILRRLNARLRLELGSKPRRAGNADSALVVVSTASSAMLAGRLAVSGASVAGAGAVAGIALPVVGIGLGVAAGAFLLWRRKVQTNRQQAMVWLREVLGEARASLSDEIMHRFTELQYALTVALDEAVERRLGQLDAQISEIDRSMADDKATRQRKKASLQQDRDALRNRIKQLDEVLVRARQVVPAAPDLSAGRS